MKLYELPQRQGVKLIVNGHTLTFDHMDGAYSFCTDDETGEVVHLSCITKLKAVGDKYEVVSTFLHPDHYPDCMTSEADK